MKNPIIGITFDFENSGGYSKFPWYAIRENYLTCLYKYGAIPFPILHENSLNNTLLEVLDVASLVLEGVLLERTQGATHYHAYYVKPRWSIKKKRFKYKDPQKNGISRCKSKKK